MALAYPSPYSRSGNTAVDPSHPSSCQDIEAEISRYCAAHRDAGDTLDGIAWWLMRQRLHDTREQIAAAAERLLHRGLLYRRVLPDGTVLFCCRPDPAPSQPQPFGGGPPVCDRDAP